VKSKAGKKAKASKTQKTSGARKGRAPGPRDKVLERVLSEVTAEPQTQHLEQWVQVPCPYCGEEFEVHATSEQDGQTMYEDCHVCCRPVALLVHAEEGELHVEAHRS